MPVYRYTLTAEIEVEAPNVQAAEHALRRCSPDGTPWVRAVGNLGCSVKLPSQRPDERRLWAAIHTKRGKITRNPR